MKMKSSKAKGILLPTLIGGTFLFLATFTIALGALMNLFPVGQHTMGEAVIEYGPKGAMLSYFTMWAPNAFPHWIVFPAQTLVILAVILFFAHLVFALVRKQPNRIVSAFLFSLAVAALPYFFILFVGLYVSGQINYVSTLLASIGVALNLLSIVLLLAPVVPLVFGEAQKEKEPEPEKAEENVPTITEREVRAIAKELIHEHVIDRHRKGAPVQYEEPKKAEPEPESKPEPIEEPKGEPQEEAKEVKPQSIVEEVEDEEKNSPFGNGRRRAKFETRLRESEYDLRHKYYDLRDYLKWYGVNNRVSIPGDTFSLHRERFAFITINGKHIKIYVALDPAKYEGTTMPIERVESKKFEDLPTALRVRSDLSYRRAKQLIDDLMEEKGLPKPEGPAPHETQEEK